MLLHTWRPGELTFERDYNVQGKRLPRLADEPYEGGAWVVVAPGTTMTEHVNPAGESEVFFVTDGTGVMRVDGEHQRVGPGDTILVPPGRRHSLTSDATGPLRALALWWGAAKPDGPAP
jgi:mannose-6-phosphate isomerase-like protein (cupin superfamily)